MTTVQATEQQYRTTVTIVISLIVGQLIFAGVAWWLNNSREITREPVLITHPLILSWLLVGAGSVFGASFFRSSILGRRGVRAGLGRTGAKTESPAALQSKIVLMWALLEGAGLMGLVVYFLFGVPQVLSAVLGYIAVAAIIFFPRRDWFGRSDQW